MTPVPVLRQPARTQPRLIAILDHEFSKRSLTEGSEIFAREDVWWDPVQSLADVIQDPVVLSSGAIIPTDSGGRTIAAPVAFDGFEILLELGLDCPDVAELKAAGVIP